MVIKECVQLFSNAASNAVKASFHSVELHAANDYLRGQFLQSVSNERADKYGGSVDSQVRFPIEVIKAVVEAVGAERTAVRISPWSTFQSEG